MAKCEWCGEPTIHDTSCYKCWEFVNRLEHALHIKKLFTMMKRLVEARTKEIHEDGHF